LAGIAGGALARDWFGSQAKWMGSLDRRLEDQSSICAQQRLALDALAGAVNELRAGPMLADSNKSCLTMDDLRAALARDVQGAPAAAPAAAASSAATEEAVRAGEHARDEVSRLVDRAASLAGVWNDEDASEFRSLIGQMTPPQRDQAMSIVMMALNERRLKLAAHAPF
jgi:hypothetical protein